MTEIPQTLDDEVGSRLLSLAPIHLRRVGEGLGLEVDLTTPLGPRGAGCGLVFGLVGTVGLLLAVLFAEPWAALAMLPGLVFTGLLAWWLRRRPSVLALDAEQMRVGGWTTPLGQVERVDFTRAGGLGSGGWLVVRAAGVRRSWLLGRDHEAGAWFAFLASEVLRRRSLLAELQAALFGAPIHRAGETWGVHLVVAREGWWAPAARWLALFAFLTTFGLGPALLAFGLGPLLTLLILWGLTGGLWLASRRARPLTATLDTEALYLGTQRIPLHSLGGVAVEERAGWTWLVVRADGSLHRWPLRRGIAEAAGLAETATRLAAMSRA